MKFLVVTPFADTPEILIFGVILGIFLMIASRKWKMGIFSILASGVWLYLMIELKSETAMIIVLIGLMAVELYQAFFHQGYES